MLVAAFGRCTCVVSYHPFKLDDWLTWEAFLELEGCRSSSNALREVLVKIVMLSRVFIVLFVPHWSRHRGDV